jgi:hypothetical protein
MKCQVKWIDCSGRDTADDNEAIGLAILGENQIPICRDHAKFIGRNRTHHAAS